MKKSLKVEEGKKNKEEKDTKNERRVTAGKMGGGGRKLEKKTVRQETEIGKKESRRQRKMWEKKGERTKNGRHENS